VAYPGIFFRWEGGRGFARIFFSGGFNKFNLRTEGRENRDLGVVAP
jgi:hypothetical protein